MIKLNTAAMTHSHERIPLMKDTQTKHEQVRESEFSVLLYLLPGNCYPGFIVTGMLETALEVATDPNHKFDLAIQFGRFDIAKEIATKFASESKWEWLGGTSMST